MNVEGFLARLSGVRRSGSGWIARCPAHEDRDPSLSVREGEGGRILLNCFAGCSVEAVCAGLGGRVRDLFAEPGERRNPEPAVVRDARRQTADLRSQLTPREREREVTVVLTQQGNLDEAIARALALAVEGELVQVAFDEGER